MTKNPKYYENPRIDLTRLVPDGACRVLEVGCGVGMLGAALKKERVGGIEVVGIELDPDMGRKAEENIDKVIVGDIEIIELPFKKDYFDCIIYGDVLEHLIDPWKALKKLCVLLNKDGRVIASIPNIAHYRVMKMLKKLEWNYNDSGILDKSHVRFFTRKSIEEMFKNSGLEIVKLERKIGASKVKLFLNKILLGALSDRLTEQYIVVAKKMR